MEIARNYRWMQQLELADSLGKESTFYNPSLDFTSAQNGKSLSLTADYNKEKKLEFSIWYDRPKEVKILFGLLGKKEKMVIDDIWGVDFQTSLQYLQYFVDGEYDKIEKLFIKS